MPPFELKELLLKKEIQQQMTVSKTGYLYSGFQDIQYFDGHNMIKNINFSKFYTFNYDDYSDGDHYKYYIKNQHINKKIYVQF